MNKLIILAILSFSMTGCGMFSWGKKPEPETEIEYVEVAKPVSNVPMPPNTDCPDLEIEKTKTDASDGEVAKAYRITVEQLRDCSQLREKVIDKYREIAEEDAERIEEFRERNDRRSTGGPFSSSGPTNPMSAPTNQGVEDLDDLRRQMTIERDFQDLESEFEELTEKEYEIE